MLSKKGTEAREDPLVSADESPRISADTFNKGVLMALLMGLFNGSVMVTITCFTDGCPVIAIPSYEQYGGTVLPPLAFLPSLIAGIAIMHPILFLLYWGPSMKAGVWPQFHVKKVAIPALLTGAFWSMGNFASMFATVYLGQALGFPLTQCCLVVNGSFGILFFKEIRGAPAIRTFVLAAVLLLAGATLNGISC